MSLREASPGPSPVALTPGPGAAIPVRSALLPRKLPAARDDPVVTGQAEEHVHDL